MNAKYYPYFLAIITMIFWGAAPIFGKIGLTKINPYMALAIRSFIVSLILLIILLIRGDIRELVKVDLKSIAFIGIEGIFAALIGQFAYYYALKLGETSKIVPIASAFPLITLLIAVIFLSEKITIIKSSGILLIIAGIILLRF
ncbi:MAG: EamA family transporter [Actinobacteria bacterium]|nr:EamA family transporter [Cyanobacteriota bacterium]MCL5771187.1 EamA family transporter [Actinomycetota bacterium]